MYFIVLAIFIFCQGIVFANGVYKPRKEYNLCNPKLHGLNPPVVYLEYPGVETHIFVNWQIQNTEQFSTNCVMVFKTCKNCRVAMEVSDSNLDRSYICTGSFEYEACRPGCSYIYSYDADYKKQTKRMISLSFSDVYLSETSKLYIRVCRDPSNDKNETSRLRIFSEDKIQRITDDDTRLSSPFFPDPCIQNGEFYKYLIDRSQSKAFITITFSDWLLSPYAEFQFKGANIAGLIKGTNRRPYIISNGHELDIEYYTGTYKIPGSYLNYLGFRAEIKYYQDRDQIPQVLTDCGGVIENTGGIITLKRTDYVGSAFRDCIWLVKRPYGYMGVNLVQSERSHIKSTGFSMEVRDGLTSLGTLKVKKHSSSYINHAMVPNITSFEGFYIRLQGKITQEDNIILAFAAFKYGEEYTFRSVCDYNEDEFLCLNGRCISKSLRCDGYNHCGDNSDELATTCKTSTGETDYTTGMHAGIGMVIPLVVTIVVVIIFTTFLIVFIQRCRRLNRQQGAQMRSTLRGRRDCGRTQNVQMSVTVSSGEHPPSYNEVMRSTSSVGDVNVGFRLVRLTGSSFMQAVSLTTGEDSMSAPPSYNEAIAAANFDLSLPTRNESMTDSSTSPSDDYITETTFTETRDSYWDSRDYSIANTRPRSPRSAAELASSFDPDAYMSSSSSSDDNYQSRDGNESDPSDSSTDNDSLFTQGFVSINHNDEDVDQIILSQNLSSVGRDHCVISGHSNDRLRNWTQDRSSGYSRSRGNNNNNDRMIRDHGSNRDRSCDNNERIRYDERSNQGRSYDNDDRRRDDERSNQGRSYDNDDRRRDDERSNQGRSYDNDDRRRDNGRSYRGRSYDNDDRRRDNGRSYRGRSYDNERIKDNGGSNQGRSFDNNEITRDIERSNGGRRYDNDEKTRDCERSDQDRSYSNGRIRNRGRNKRRNQSDRWRCHDFDGNVQDSDDNSPRSTNGNFEENRHGETRTCRSRATPESRPWSHRKQGNVNDLQQKGNVSQTQANDGCIRENTDELCPLQDLHERGRRQEEEEESNELAPMYCSQNSQDDNEDDGDENDSNSHQRQSSAGNGATFLTMTSYRDFNGDLSAPLAQIVFKTVNEGSFV